MSLGADAGERVPVPGGDVVGVEAVEAGGLGAPHEMRVREHAHALERLQRLCPVSCRVAVGDVEEVREPLLLQRLDVLGVDAGVRPRYGSRWIATPSPCAFAVSVTSGRRRSSGDSHPHQDTITVRIPAEAISRMCAVTIFALDDE